MFISMQTWVCGGEIQWWFFEEELDQYCDARAGDRILKGEV